MKNQSTAFPSSTVIKTIFLKYTFVNNVSDFPVILHIEVFYNFTEELTITSFFSISLGSRLQFRTVCGISSYTLISICFINFYI